MLPLRYGWVWLTIGSLLLASGLLVALLPTSTVMPVNLNDKLLHATVFFLFMVWFSGLFQPRHVWRVALALFLYGVLIEVLQSLTTTRQAEFLDLVADTAGILLGWLLGAAGLRHWGTTFEQWLARRNP